MLRSLLHHPGNTLLALMSIAILIVSFGAHSDTNTLTDNDYLLDPYETDQRMMNISWLEQGMKEMPNNYESNAALQVLAERALKKYWGTLAQRDKRYERLSPIVSGHFTSMNNRTNYDLNLSSNVIKLSLNYDF